MIGVGGCGDNNITRMMKKTPLEDNRQLHILLCDLDGCQLRERLELREDEPEHSNNPFIEKWIESDQFEIYQIGGLGMGAGGKPEVSSKIVEEDKEFVAAVEAFCKKVDLVRIIGGAGGGSASGALPIIAKIAKEMGKSPMVILTIPRASEGKGRVRKAEELQKELLTICPTLVIQNEKMPNTDIPFEQAWDQMNDKTTLPILDVQRITIQKVGRKNSDVNDEKSLLELGNYPQSGFCEVPEGDGENAPDFNEIARELLSNPYQDTNIVNKALGIGLTLVGDSWTPAQTDQIVNYIQQRMDKSLDNPKFEIVPNVYDTVADGPLAGKKFVSMLAIAADPPSDTVVADEGKGIHNDIQVQVRFGAETIAMDGKKIIQCVVNEKPVPLSVSEDLARQWNAVIQQKKIDPEFFQKLREKVQAETGHLPDMPKAGFLSQIRRAS